MAWNPLDKLKKTFGLGKDESRAPNAATAPTQDAPKGGWAGLKELQHKGMLGQFFRRWKDPAFKAQLDALAARMKADGVDVKDQKAVQAWIEKNQAAIQSGELLKVQKGEVKTFVKSGSEQGRNDPCACGSGKKYKKCCAVN